VASNAKVALPKIRFNRTVIHRIRSSIFPFQD
jgi:hypothetical protein